MEKKSYYDFECKQKSKSFDFFCLIMQANITPTLTILKVVVNILQHNSRILNIFPYLYLYLMIMVPKVPMVLRMKMFCLTLLILWIKLDLTYPKTLLTS